MNHFDPLGHLASTLLQEPSYHYNTTALDRKTLKIEQEIRDHLEPASLYKVLSPAKARGKGMHFTRPR
jgi:hypothetical protein